jgi:hypothetical protein
MRAMPSLSLTDCKVFNELNDFHNRSGAESLITTSLAGDNKDKTPDETHRALSPLN